MPLVDWKCPECGREIRVDTGRETCYCNACGKKVSIASTMGTGHPTHAKGLVDWKCPACGREIRVDSSLDSCFCNACGKKLVITPEKLMDLKTTSTSFSTSQSREPAGTNPSAAPQAPNRQESDTPGAGKVFGAFLLCWFVMAGTCGIASMAGMQMMYGKGALTGGYSAGGLLGFALSIVFAFMYRKSGDLLHVVCCSIFAGFAIGIIVVVVGPTILAMRYG